MPNVEEKIAHAIIDECGERFYDINEFCETYGFTKEEFFDFLQHGIDAMAACRILNNCLGDKNND